MKVQILAAVWVLLCLLQSCSTDGTQEHNEVNYSDESEGYKESGAQFNVETDKDFGEADREWVDAEEQENYADFGSSHSEIDGEQSQQDTLDEDSSTRNSQESSGQNLKIRQLNERKQEGIHAARRTIHASMYEGCDWRVNPLKFLRGEVCGAHYKVLGVDRKSKQTNSKLLRKKYRQLSLQLHPDKNPAPEAEEAFTVLQAAYQCIADDMCRSVYDDSLSATEEQIAIRRENFKQAAINRSLVVLTQAHYYVSLAANKIFQIGMNFWDMISDWQVTIFDETYPIGRPVVLLLLLWKGQFLLKLHALSYAIIRINYEIAKARGWT